MKFLRGSKTPDGIADLAALERARRTHAAIDGDVLEVWPWWLERQRRDAFAGSTGAGDLGLTENTTGRTWTSVGPLDGPGASVDPAGLVTPEGQEWSLDWWVGAEDRWYFPSMEASTRQERSGAAPILETSVRVPGGDIRQTVFGATAPDGSSVTVVEIENLTPVPVALALAVRPATPLGAGRVDGLASEGEVVRVDRARRVVFDRPPAHAIAAADRDVVAAVTAGAAAAGGTTSATSETGFANGAWIFPLAHTAKLRCWLPTTEGADLPDLDAGDIASGWTRHLDKIARIELGDPLLDGAFLAASADLLRASGRGVTAPPVGRDSTWGLTEQLFTIDAMARCGLDDEVAASLEEALDGGRAVTGPAEARNVLATANLATAARQGAATAERSLGTLARLVSEQPSGDASPNALSAALDSIGQPDVADAARTIDMPGSVSAPGGFAAQILDAAERLTGSDADDDANDDLLRLLRVGAATGSWPTAVHPRIDAGSAGSGNDPGSSAAVVRALSMLAVDERTDGLALLPAFDASWLGRSIDIHDLVTPYGLLSFAVRWHGARPALLWELQPTWEPSTTVMLSAPALDPAWRTSDLRGDALLAEPSFGSDSEQPVSFQ